MTKKWRTDYAGHDRAYVKRKAEGLPGWDDDYAERRQSLMQWFKQDHIPRQGRVLELGCGAGNVGEWFAQRGYDVVGVDIAEHAIAWARERLAGSKLPIEFKVGSVLDLGFEPQSFDLVYDSHCFHCIIGDDRSVFLEQAKSVLRPGGLLHIDTMSGDSSDPEIMSAMDPETRVLGYGDLATRYLGRQEDIIAEVKNAGFEIIATSMIPDPVHPDLLLIDARRQ